MRIDYLGADVDAKILFRFRLKKRVWSVGLLANSCFHGYELLGSLKGGKLLTNLGVINFSRRPLLHG
jgi:hypothetical protein